MRPKMHGMVKTYGLDVITGSSELPLDHIGIAVEQDLVLRMMNDGWEFVDDERPYLGYRVTMGRFHSREETIKLQELCDIWADTPENRGEAIRIINQKRGDSPSNVHLVLYGGFKHPKFKKKVKVLEIYPNNQEEKKTEVQTNNNI